jgi:hypothetical protein
MMSPEQQQKHSARPRKRGHGFFHGPTFIRRNPFSFILMSVLLFFLAFGSGMLFGAYAYMGMDTNPYVEMQDNVDYEETSIEASQLAIAAAKPGCAGYAYENITAVAGVIGKTFICSKAVATYGTIGQTERVSETIKHLFLLPAKGTQFEVGKFYYAGKGTETWAKLDQIEFEEMSFTSGGEIQLVYPRSFPYYVGNNAPFIFFIDDGSFLPKATDGVYSFCDYDQLDHPELLFRTYGMLKGSVWKQSGENFVSNYFTKGYQSIGMVPLAAALFALGALEYYFFAQNERDYSLRVTLGQPWPLTLLALLGEQMAISVPTTALGIGLTYWLVPFFFQLQIRLDFLWFYGGACLVYLVLLTALFFIKVRSRSSFLKERKSI